MAKSSPKRRQRRHGDLPAGFLWRDGRPRWVPSPTRRKQGWKAIDLRDAWRNWLARGAAIERAEEIARALDAWAKGEPVPARFAAIAPAGATTAGASASALKPRSIGTLLDAYFDSAEFKGRGKIKGLAPATQADYRNKIHRFFIGPKSDTPAYAAKLARLRGLEIDGLLPPAFNEPGEFLLKANYDHLREVAGEHMAAGALAAVSAWLGWCVDEKRVWPANPARHVKRTAPEGRIVTYDWPELIALVRQADAAGFPSIADAIVFAVDLSWSQQDLLALGLGQISRDGHVKHRRIKTGNAGNPKLLAIGQRRLALIRQRWAQRTVQPTHLIVCELTGEQWTPDAFRHKFAGIRDAVGHDLPSIAGKQFRDLRDTSITYCHEAGLDLAGICSRTLHAMGRAQAVLDKHYAAIRQGVADEAADKLDAYFARMGYTFDMPLALPGPGS